MVTKKAGSYQSILHGGNALSSAVCRSMFVTHSNNSVAWNSSYCDDDGGGCSAGWSSSCGGGDGGCGRSRRQTGGGLWKTAAAGRAPHLPSGSRCAGWSRTSSMYPTGGSGKGG